MLRFLHTADWQIGMKAAHVGVVGERVRAERLEAARRVVALANQQQVAFIAVTGDTFEDNAVDRILVQKIADILAGFAGPVFIISGNHDPLVPGSVWDHAAWRSHANLHVIRETQPLSVAGCTLYPCPLFEKHSLKDPTHGIDARDTDTICVGLAHGTVAGIAPTDLDYPIARDAAERAGLDYLALGHWHSFASFEGAGGVSRMAYAGTHETTKFGERDSGNALLVEIAQRGAVPKLTPLRTGGLIWTSLEHSILDEGDLTRVCREVESWSEPERTLVCLRLEGILHPAEQAELQRLEQLVAARCLYGRIEAVSLRPRPDDDQWLNMLPPGLIRDAAGRLTQLADPAYSGQRPAHATPDVAAHALLQLYRLVQESAG